MKIATLYRYPVKGLSAEALDQAELTAGGYFPGDRLFAIENGPSGFDPLNPEHQPKIKFLMLMRDEQLAKLSTHYDDASGVLTIARDGKQVCRANLTQPIGHTLIEQFFAAFMKQNLRGAPKLLEAPEGFRFTDSAKGFVSLINLASVADLTRVVGREVEPLRFRANVYFDGLEPWHEFDFVGKELTIGNVRLEVLKRIQRCAATNVNPMTAERDLNIPNALMQGFDHTDCGIYARVLQGGRIRPGDTIEIAA